MNAARTDIASRADIERLVNGFYDRVRRDDLLGPIFDDVAQTDWAHHLPKMYAFWEGVLFGAPGFRGNPLAIHRALARRVPLGPREFGRWLALFHATIDDAFAGPCAEDAKARAVRIAGVMQYHIGADAAVTPSGSSGRAGAPSGAEDRV
jgi:hemoglobin